MIPITEMSNEITKDLDIASSREIVSLLISCNSQVFNISPRTDGHWSFMCNEITQRTERVVEEVKTLIESVSNMKQNAIIFSGCGTSGRLAFLAAKQMQYLLKDHENAAHLQIYYTISGGDTAIVMSTEAPEDDWRAGLKLLEELNDDPGVASVIFVGISCGLSAPFVAGQLHFCLNHLNKFFPVAIGFNPLSLARCHSIPSSGSPPWSFRDVLKEMELQHDRSVLINPVIGPEPITGSSRMKGGSATKILLDTIVISSVLGYQNISPDIRDIFRSYHNLHKSIQKNNDYIVAVAKSIELAGEAMKNGGRIFYIGKSDTAGVLGLIDASECLPTFGTDFNDVRGFVKGGHQSLSLSDSEFCEKPGSSPVPDISLTHFSSVYLSTLSSNDLLVIIGSNPLSDETTSLLQKVMTNSKLNSNNGGIKVVQIQLHHEISYDAKCVGQVHCCIPSLDYNQEELLEGGTPHIFLSSFEDLVTKWTLNAISSGAHVMKGKVFKNIMIDVKVSNSKLFHRAVDIIREVAGVSKEEAEACLLQSIYGNDIIALENFCVSDHVRTACGMDYVVPVSIVIAKTHDTILNAKKYLKKFVILRNAIRELSASKLSTP